MLGLPPLRQRGEEPDDAQVWERLTDVVVEQLGVRRDKVTRSAISESSITNHHFLAQLTLLPRFGHVGEPLRRSALHWSCPYPDQYYVNKYTGVLHVFPNRLEEIRRGFLSGVIKSQ